MIKKLTTFGFLIIPLTFAIACSKNPHDSDQVSKDENQDDDSIPWSDIGPSTPIETEPDDQEYQSFYDDSEYPDIFHIRVDEFDYLAQDFLALKGKEYFEKYIEPYEANKGNSNYFAEIDGILMYLKFSTGTDELNNPTWSVFNFQELFDYGHTSWNETKGITIPWNEMTDEQKQWVVKYHPFLYNFQLRWKEDN